MIALVVVAAVVIGLIWATVATVGNDRPRTPPRSRFVDPDFLPPAERCR